MKRNIFISLAACALTVLGVSSCQKDELKSDVQSGTHTVTINASLEDNTKTALLIKVVPSWKNTANDDVYLYENGTAGTNCAITTPIEGSYEKATFSATFTGTSAPFTYTGVIASKDGEYFTIPATQNPNTESLLDPKADFLVGTSNEYAEQQTSIKMTFARPVALSRLAITNLDGVSGEVIKSVKIVSTDYLTGKVAYDNIDFASKTANFTGTSKELTIDYGTGVSFGGTFYAYFVSLPGTKAISSVVITTNKCTYTKAVGKSSIFNANEFKNIALDMTDANRDYVKTYYRKVKEAQFTEGTYLLVYNNNALDASVNKYSTSVTIKGDSILATNELAGAAIEITKKNSKYFLNTTKGYLYCASSGASDLSFNITENDNYLHTASWSNDKVKFSNNSRYLGYQSSSSAYQYRGSSNAVSFTLYLLEGSSKPSRNLQFAEASVSKKISDSDFTNTLSGVTTGVTYSSNNTAVATVNSTTGLVHIVGEGTATITASAPETDEYKAGTATFTLKVTDPSKTVTYKQVASITSGKQYLVVNYANNQALTVCENSSSANHTAVSPNANNEIVLSSNDAINTNCVFTITLSGENYTFLNGTNNYLVWDNNYTTTYLGFGSTIDEDTIRTFTLPNSGNNLFYFKSTTTVRTNEWIYYNSKGYFKIGGSGAYGETGAGVYLYEKQQ